MEFKGIPHGHLYIPDPGVTRTIKVASLKDLEELIGDGFWSDAKELEKLLKFADFIDDLRRAGGSLALPEFYDAVFGIDRSK